MANRIGVGIIGASVDRGPDTNAHLPWAPVAHTPAIDALDQFELIAVGTTKPETADAAKRYYSAKYSFSDSEKLVNHPDVDLVVVSVRVPYHYDLVKAAIDAGKHVYCEWPLTLNSEMAEDLAARAASKNVVAMVGLQARAAPTFKYAKHLVDTGYIGKLLSVNVSFNVPTWGLEVEEPVSYLHDIKNNATLLSIYGGHSLDVLSYVVGDLSELYAIVTRRMETVRIIETGEEREKTSPDQVAITGSLNNGGVFSYHLQAGIRNIRGVEVRIYGTGGDLVIKATDAIETSPLSIFGVKTEKDDSIAVEYGGRGELKPLAVPAQFRRMPAEVNEGPALNVGELYLTLADAILEGKPYEPTFETASKVHLLLEDITRSSEESRRIVLG